MATAFLATACAGTSAPLNPRYTSEDYKFYLSDLNAKALIVLQGTDSLAVEVAQELGVKILEISISDNQPVGAFALSDGAASPSTSIEYCQDKDCALLLHPSGTTSRPKLVPLTHGNICMSAVNIGKSLSLETDDRCINVMPLFHIHGLVGALFSSLSSGGSVICAPDFNEDKFFDWVAAMRPTWYTAVPTMHQAILNRALNNPQIMGSHSFRFIRSCSASLPPTLKADLEKVFNTPVIEAYGMTEASHQISVNPLPPHQRKPKSVGLPTGTQVAIMDATGELQSAGDIGEIVIKGPGITNGYANNPAANEEGF